MVFVCLSSAAHYFTLFSFLFFRIFFLFLLANFLFSTHSLTLSYTTHILFIPIASEAQESEETKAKKAKRKAARKAAVNDVIS
jgi:hypothetical protein